MRMHVKMSQEWLLEKDEDVEQHEVNHSLTHHKNKKVKALLYPSRTAGAGAHLWFTMQVAADDVIHKPNSTCHYFPPVVTFPASLASSPIGWYQIMLLGEQRHMCVNDLARDAAWQWNGQGTKLATYRSLVQHPTCSTTTTHRHHK